MTSTASALRALALVVGLVALAFAVASAARPRSGDIESRPAPVIRSDTWLNSEPLETADLRGKVVLVEFWTFGCWNCHNVEPYLTTWHDRYADQGLVVVAVHTPEFDWEKRVEKLRAYLAEKGIRYPVAIDNDRSIWRAFHNRYWPAMYLIDKTGQIRHVRIGEGGYETTQAAIERLLAE